MAELMKKRSTGLAFPADLGSLHQEMDKLFGKFFGEMRPMEVVGSAIVDVKEDTEHVYIDAEMPGMAKEDMEVTIENGILTMSGEKKYEEKQGKDDLRERYFGRIYRSLTLPSTVDENKVKAVMKNGVLHIVLDKTGESKPRRIPIE